MPREFELPLSEFVVLGLVAESPRHGYEVEKEIQRRRLRQWARLGRSLVYDVLERLRRRGWIGLREAHLGNGPVVRRAHLTAKGREALTQAIAHAIAVEVLQPSRTEVALMFSWLLPSAAFAEAVDARVRLASRELAESRMSRERYLSDDPAVRRGQTAIFDHFDAVLAADLAWAQAIAASLPE